ncbi:MAG: hypothetical protein AAGB18_02760 [Pseudomonadota bacterium]
MALSLSPHLLTGSQRHDPERSGIRFLNAFSLALARVHEFCGPARRTLALETARGISGEVFWIAPAWASDRLNGAALPPWVNPGRITHLAPKRAEDLLWTMEEVLRAGVVPLVVGDFPEPPPLTPIRRLHLAAEAGATAGLAPLGLVLTPGPGGAAGVESRWSLDPCHGPGNQTAWALERLRARAAPPARWKVGPSDKGGLRLASAEIAGTMSG